MQGLFPFRSPPAPPELRREGSDGAARFAMLAKELGGE
jgi:hypothetical protein